VVCGDRFRLRTRGPRGCFRSECRTGGKSVAAPRVNCSLSPTHQRRARGWTGHKCRFSSLRYCTTGNRTLSTTFGGASKAACVSSFRRAFLAPLLPTAKNKHWETKLILETRVHQVMHLKTCGIGLRKLLFNTCHWC